MKIIPLCQRGTEGDFLRAREFEHDYKLFKAARWSLVQLVDKPGFVQLPDDAVIHHLFEL